jgi:ribosomal protein L34E
MDTMEKCHTVQHGAGCKKQLGAMIAERPRMIDAGELIQKPPHRTAG